jgi:hypothetical protein
MWHTVEIKVPSHLIVLTKAGKPKLKPTLTKLGNLSRFAKQTSIKLIPEDVDVMAQLKVPVPVPVPVTPKSKLKEIDEIQVYVDWSGGKTYKLSYKVGNKVLKIVEYPEKSLPRDEAEKWVKQNGRQLREKYNVCPLSQLKIRIV